MKYIPKLTKRYVNIEPLDGCLHKRKINVPYAIEVISEVYGDVLPLLDNNSLVYGGIIRDIIAGMFPLIGDLDIVTSNISYPTVVEKFSSCNKITWKPKLRSKPYTERTYIGALTNFETYDGNRIQIIKSANKIMDVIASTDLVCCGVVMTHVGDVFEVIRGAEDDCNKRILTINKNGNIRYEDINERIKKLVKRGWKSEINMSEVKKICNKNRRSPSRKKSHFNLAEEVKKLGTKKRRIWSKNE